MSLPIIVGNDDYEDEAVLRYVLSRFLPGSFEDDPADMSGMDCFVAVIRHICSVADRGLMDFVASNDELKFVMADYSAETEEKRKRVQEYRLAAFEKVERMVGKEKPTFEDIIECKAVRKTFWAHYGLLLFQPLVYRSELDEVWHSKADDSMFEAAQSLVKWPLQDYAAIEDVLTETKFGVGRINDGQRVRFTFGKPAMVRVRLASKVNRETWKGSNFSIRDVQYFSYNVVTRNTVWNASKDRTTVRDTPSQKPQDRLVYCLIAVVRLRNPGDDRDFARLYDIEAQNVLPHGDQQYLKTFDSDFWSLGHLDHDHMLYYARADCMSVDCIRRCMEIGDQEPDHESVRRDERLMETLWQTTRAMTEFPESGSAIEDDFGGDRVSPSISRPFG